MENKFAMKNGIDWSGNMFKSLGRLVTNLEYSRYSVKNESFNTRGFLFRYDIQRSK